MTLGPCHAHVEGFDLHAGLVTRAGRRDRLERLCRCALQPPLARDRLPVDAEGDTWLALRHRWADGTTHLRFDPLELLERLAVLTPRPRVNLIFYYGVLAPRARIILARAEGRATTSVAKRLHVSATTVCKWRTRFLRDRVDGLYDEPRPGAPRQIAAALSRALHADLWVLAEPR